MVGTHTALSLALCILREIHQCRGMRSDDDLMLFWQLPSVVGLLECSRAQPRIAAEIDVAI